MQGIYLIVFQVFIIIFYGIFVRTPTSDTYLSSNISTIASGFYFLLAFTCTSFKYKMFDWSMLTNMLFILIVCLQLNTLYVMFWMSCFDGFYSSSGFGAIHVIAAIQAALSIMVTSFQFAGLLNITQLFLLAMVQVFGFALNWTMQYKGITAMTGGAVMTSFLFGYIMSIPIRKLKFGDKAIEQQKQKYFTLHFKFIGLVLLIFLWPSFNVMTSIPDLTLSNISSSALLLQQAYLQTFLCLLSGVITTFALRIYGEKIQINQFISSIINTGILIGASSSVIIDPFASFILGVAGPIIYLVYEKYFYQFHLKRYPLDKVIVCLIAAVLNAIFVAGRAGRSPTLAINYTTQAGYQFANFVLSACFALVFGLIAGFLLKSINFSDEQVSNKDSSIWLMDQQIMPLYSDDPLLLTFFEKDTDKKLKKQQENFNLKQSFINEKVRQNTELGKILKQQIQYESRIR